MTLQSFSPYMVARLKDEFETRHHRALKILIVNGDAKMELECGGKFTAEELEWLRGWGKGVHALMDEIRGNTCW